MRYYVLFTAVLSVAFVGVVSAASSGCTSDPIASAGDPCDPYCKAMTATCTGNETQYISTGSNDIATCLAMCATFSLTGAVDGNNLECRNNKLSLASELPDGDPKKRALCINAGPYPGVDTAQGKCGDDPCSSFCALDVALCTGNEAAYPGGVAECRAFCNDHSSGVGVGFNIASISDPTTAISSTAWHSVDNFACRAYHLEAAAKNRPVHCLHTRQFNSATCVNLPDDAGADAASDAVSDGSVANDASAPDAAGSQDAAKD